MNQFASAKSGCEVSLFEKNCGLLHEIVQVTTPGEHQRRSEEQYAAETGLDPKLVKQLFRRTGNIKCGGRTETAQLTGADYVLTTAGHIFFNEDCTRRNFDKCTFAPDSTPGGREVEVDISPLSLKLGKCGQVGSVDDWASVRLKESMPDVSFYDIPVKGETPPSLKATDKEKKGKPVLQVTSAQSDFPVKSIENCFIKDLDDITPGSVQHDCNTGKKGSGAGQFVRLPKRIHPKTGETLPEKTVLAAINVSEADIKRTGGIIGTGYDKKKLYNLSVPLAGKFLDAVYKNIESGRP